MNRVNINKFLESSIYFKIGLALGLALVFTTIFSQSVNAIQLNSQNLPYNYQVHRWPNGAGSCPGGQFRVLSHWPSVRGQPHIDISEPYTSGTTGSSMSLQMNILGNNCARNISPHTPFEDLSGNLGDRNTLRSKVHVRNTHTTHGSLDSISRGNAATINWEAFQQAHRGGNDHFYIKASANGDPVNLPFRLYNLPYGNYTATVTIGVKWVVRYVGGTHPPSGYANFACADPHTQAVANLDDYGRCRERDIVFKIRVNNPAPPTYWSYNVGLSSIPSTINAGSRVNFSSTTRNTGSGTGMNYSHQFIRRNNSGSWANVQRRDNQGGLLRSGASSNRDRRTVSSGYTIPSNTPDGTQICFIARVNPHRGQSTPSRNSTGHPNGSGRGWKNSTTRCTRVNNPRWNLTINWISGRRPSDVNTSTFPKPGDSFRIGTRVTNTGDGASARYRYWVEPLNSTHQRWVSNHPYLGKKVSADGTYPGLGSGSSRTIITGGAPRYTVSETTAGGAVVPEHNRQICFDSRVNNVQGYTVGGRVTNSGTRRAGTNCLRVFNTRYDLESVNASNVPTTVYPGEEFTFSYRTCNTDDVTNRAAHSANPHNVAASAGNAPGVTITNRVEIKGGAIIAGPQNVTHNVPRGAAGCRGGDRTVTIPESTPPGSEICVYVSTNREWGWSISGSGGDHRGSLNNGDDDCFIVVDSPYLQVLGNSIASGVQWCDESSNCEPDVTGIEAVISGTSNGDSSSAVGSLVQFAARALDEIAGFGSANRPEPASGSRNLTFSNIVAAALGHFASGVDKNGAAVKLNYTLEQLQAESDTTPSPSSDGQYYYGSDLVVPDVFQNTNLRTTLVVDGDVYINHNITYDQSSYSSAGAMPSIAIIASGNITIDQSVTQLDGLYMALGSGSIISTCGTSSSDHRQPTSLSQNECSSQLMVNGALAADQIHFKRTYGSVNGTNTVAGGEEPAEIINFSPEMYIAPPLLKGIDGGVAEIMQRFDLPPLF